MATTTTTTTTATQLTTGILSRQQELLETAKRLTDEDQQRRNEANRRLDQAKSLANNQLNQARASADSVLKAVTDNVDGTIREIEAMNAAVNSALSMAWERIAHTNGRANPLVPTNANPLQRLMVYRNYADDARGRALQFLRSHRDPSGFRQGTGWGIAIPVGLVSCTMCSLVASNEGGDSGWTLLFLAILFGAIGLGGYFGLLTLLYAPLRNALASLQFAESEARGLRHLALQAPQAQHQQAIATAEAIYRQAINAAEATFQQTMTQIEDTRVRSFMRVRPSFETFAIDVGTPGAPWNETSWQQWSPATSAPEATRIGTIHPCNRPELPTIPAFIPTPSKGSVIVKASGDGKKAAAVALQSVVMRQLASIPPSKVSYVFIDPVDLGQNVATFMRLAEHDELLFTSRAWTEPRHIEEQLADLARHMEDVIQKYLQNRFQTIEEYNLEAGEVAEPYRVLVVMGFPFNFTEDSMRRLVSIVKNGARCGVTALILRDTSLAMPYGTDTLLAELENNATIIEQSGGSFVWRDRGPAVGFSLSRLTLDTPPPDALADHIIEKVGEASKDNRVVQVPFARITPTLANRWAASTAKGIDAPIGRVGAKRWQDVTIGTDGVRQHALVVGRTGSGKSRLLQEMIVNLALTYSPDELEFYLIDFKKVGFASFAQHHFTHARVISTETEREFALSVLERLDAELEERKKLFGTAQDLATYRAQNPNTRMPRILLIVDEFQEFFTQDDKIFRDAALYLDRLVRQGRGFGIHVILGSQTLRGQYTLPDATRGQMAIRIALQCDEDDSRKILSDDNPAARQLTRPGEAIYNDQNGLVAGNTIFQAAWLPDDELDAYLDVLTQLAQDKRYQPPAGYRQVIFDGAANADVTQNEQLYRALNEPHWPPSPARPLAWLGDPVAIKASTATPFRKQSGANLLMVGQQEEAALGVMSVGLLSLAAQHAPNDAMFYIVDLSPTDSPLAGYLPEIAATLPHDARIITRRGLPDAVDELHSEVKRRIENETANGRRIYLMIFGLQRARDLRMDEDAGYSSYSSYSDAPQPPDPTKQFAEIVREGPEFGVHTILWCDTLTNLNRTFERRALREFALRVAFQMSTEDSSTFVDSPAANGLGPFRALFFDEEEGRVEKFRPYAPPEQSWLSQAEAALNRKTS